MQFSLFAYKASFILRQKAISIALEILFLRIKTPFMLRAMLKY